MSAPTSLRGAEPLGTAIPSSAALTFELPGVLLDDLAQRVAGIVLARLDAERPASPWLDVAEAAEYLRCKPKRVYDLVGQDRLPVHRDGARLLFRRDELDAYLLTPAGTLEPFGDARPVVAGADTRSINPPSRRNGGRSCR